MANFCGTTTSNGIKLTKAQFNSVNKLLKKYEPSMEDVQLGEQSHWGIWGYDWIDFRKADDDSYDSMLDEFLNDLSRILNDEQKLVIQCIGGEKCRFPLAAMQIVVTKGNVLYSHPFSS